MTDPLKSLNDSGEPTPAISQKVYAIAGISVTVFGLEELRKEASEVACLWLLHPRLATQERMTGIANSTITDWNTRNQDNPSAKGLIAVSFDQRNHGTRTIDPLANESWKKGNPRHAQDMFSIFREWERIHKRLFTILTITRGNCKRYIDSHGLPSLLHVSQ